MDKEKQARLEAVGFRFGDAGDFLGLTDAERRLVEMRRASSQLIRQLRVSGNLTQSQLAEKIKSSQSRVAKMEAGSPDVSLDFLFKVILTLGGELTEVLVIGGKRAKPRKTKVGPKSEPRPKGRARKPLVEA